MLSVYHYLDYRHFLRDYYQEQKKKKGASFSFRSFTRLAGLSSPNFLKLVMEGKRNLGFSGITHFSKALHFNPEESNFFENLVRFNQSKDDNERNQWYQKLASSQKYQQIKEIENNSFVYFSHWYYPAVRELVLLPDFQENPVWISKKLCPSITQKEATMALELLLALGLLKRNSKRRLMQADQNITTAREVESLAIRNYHRQMIEQGKLSLEKFPRGKRDISSLTLALSQEKFLEAKRRIQEFRRELNVLLSDDKKVDSIYQINFQIFALSEVPWRD